MTTMQVPTQRYRKTDPDCPLRQHAPTIANFRRGCTCPPTMEFLQRWAQTQADPHCRSKKHTPTHDSWQREGCRCAATLAAHELWKRKIRMQRREALAGYKRTGQCAATVHGRLGSFRRGCRCPDTVALYVATFGDPAEMTAGLPGHRALHPWREGRMRVDRNNLWFLVHGVVDRPTYGERLAAVVILSGRGSETAGLLDSQAIADRIHVDVKMVGEYRRRIIRLRGERTQRRLADVRAKAERVAKAIARG